MSQDQPNAFKGHDGPVDAQAEIIRQMSEVRRLTKEEILQSMPQLELARMIERIGKNMWVVLDKTGRTLAIDPALRQPFHHNNKKFAESVAKELDGVVVTAHDAIRILTDKNRPND